MSETKTVTKSNPYTQPIYRWYVVTLLAVAYAVSYIDRLIISLMVDPIKASLALSDTQVSLLIGFSFAIFYATSAIPIAWLADRFSRRNIIISGITIWCLMTTACGFARNFTSLFVARMGVGFGEAALAPAANSMIADAFPKEQLGKALGVFASGIAIGVGVSLVVGGQLLAFIGPSKLYDFPLIGTIAGWQLTFIILGITGLLLGAFIFTIREPERKVDGPNSKTQEKTKGPSFSETIGYFKTHKLVYGTLFLGYAAAQTVFYATGAWIPTLFLRVYKWDVASFGTIYGLIIGVMGLVGIIAGAWASDHFYNKGIEDAHWRIIMVTFCFIPLYALIPVFNNEFITMGLLATGNLAAFAAAVAAPAAILLITPNLYRAMATALFFFTINILGMTFGPFLVALLIDNFFKDPNSIAEAIAIVSMVSWVIAMIILFLGFKFYRARIQEYNPDEDVIFE